MVSASVYGLSTIVPGWFEWPHIPGIAMNEVVENLARNTHMILAFSFLSQIAGHSVIGSLTLRGITQPVNSFLEYF